MFQFLQPIWFFAITGIAIPIIIHLWNIREGKILQVGSILLLQESAREQARSLWLKDILLLILRCLLIIVLAFLMAKPTWQTKLTSVNEKGWIVVEKQSLHEAYKNFKPTIDSLEKAGYKFHYFNNGFKADKLEDALKAVVDTSPTTKASYWNLLNQLNEQVPTDLPVYLFTNNRRKRFAGTRPKVSMNLKWNTYTAGDTMTKQLVKAYKIAKDSIRLIVGDSKPTGTFYTFENIVDKGSSLYEVINNNGKIFVTRGKADANTVEADTSTLRIAIYTDRFITDANYLKAAVDAIQQFTGLKIKTSIVNNTADIRPGIDWLFWLSEKALQSQKLPPQVFVYEKGKEQAVNSWITTENNFSVNEQPVHISRLIQDSTVNGFGFETKWRDGFGYPLLRLERKVNEIYHFYSRFDPGWNDLPWSSQFVEMIFDLLFKSDNTIKDFDSRIIDAAQLQPAIAKEAKTLDKQKFIETTDLTKLFWVIAFIIFCMERYISQSRDKSEVYA